MHGFRWRNDEYEISSCIWCEDIKMRRLKKRTLISSPQMKSYSAAPKWFFFALKPRYRLRIKIRKRKSKPKPLSWTFTKISPICYLSLTTRSRKPLPLALEWILLVGILRSSCQISERHQKKKKKLQFLIIKRRKEVKRSNCFKMRGGKKI